MSFFSLYKIEKLSIAAVTVSFYVEVERKKGRFITVISVRKWY
ncbi:hypothetical protein [Aureibaculum conchae]